MIQIPVEIGDVILTGKFKNHRVTVEEIGTDDYGLPTVNGKGIMKIRVAKLMPKKIKESTMRKINEAPAVNSPKVQKVVDQINKIIESAIDSDGDKIAVVDTGGTWQEPYIYEPIQYKNGALKITYYSVYNQKKPQVDVILKRHMEEDGIPTLRHIAKMYKAAIRKAGKPVKENRVSESTNSSTTVAFLDSLDPKVKNEVLSNIAKHYGISNQEAYEEVTDEEAESIMDYVTGSIRSTVSLYFNKFKQTMKESRRPSNKNKVTSKMKLSEVISKGVFINIKKEDGKFWFYIDTVDGPECISNVGFPTKEAAEHAALTKGFNVEKGGDAEDEMPDTVEVPKPSKRETTKGTEKPKEIDLGKEKEIKEHIVRIVKEELRRAYQKKKSLSEVAGSLKAAVEDVVKESGSSGISAFSIMSALKSKKVPGVYSIDDVEDIVSSSNNISDRRGRLYYKKSKKEGLSEEVKITKKIEQALTELKDLQDILAKANAEIEAIKKKFDMSSVQKKADEILKEQLWDFLEELKKDETKIVKLKGIILKINRHQASPATYEYEKVLDFVMTQVNQDVKAKILAELKACEKIGRTKANVSFTTEAVGGVWDSIVNFLTGLIPALKRKGSKIDNDIAKAEAQLANIE